MRWRPVPAECVLQYLVVSQIFVIPRDHVLIVRHMIWYRYSNNSNCNIVRPHHYAKHKMQLIVTDVNTQTVVCVCLYVKTVSRMKKAELPNRGAIWGMDLGGLKVSCIYCLLFSDIVVEFSSTTRPVVS